MGFRKNKNEDEKTLLRTTLSAVKIISPPAGLDRECGGGGGADSLPALRTGGGEGCTFIYRYYYYYIDVARTYKQRAADKGLS